MDFEVLLYIFIIYAILSSLFRKKKKPESPPQQMPDEKEVRTPTVKTSAGQEYDILKEIESFFKIPGEEPRHKKAEPASDYFRSTEWHPEAQSEPKHTPARQKVESWEEKRKRMEDGYRKKVDDKILRQAELFEKNLAVKHSYAVDIKKIISNKFKDPASLKEYIVISEILGKPKAFAKESFGQE
jgi:hypothetical protein